MTMAQQKLDLSITSFAIDEFSTTAQDKRYEKFDSNGDRYAIIKVKGEILNGLTFNFGQLNSEITEHEDELWVYVQRNAKTVTIKCPGYKTIERYNLNRTIQPGRTYIMTLRIGKHTGNDITKQVLQFVVTPSNEKAVVKIRKADTNDDYDIWGAVDETGSIDNIMDFGYYDYEITAPGYLPSNGRVALADSKEKYVEQVKLKPNFGYLVIEDNNGAAGAQVLVNEELIGTIPYRDTDKRWTCGTYNLTITNSDLYKPYKSTFTITEGDTTRLSPRLESDFAQTTITVNADAEILIDGKGKGIRTWTGPLKSGKYVITCKQLYHRESSMQITVKADVPEIFTIPAPTPITGSLYIRTNPSGANIVIDDKDYGITPNLLQDLLIGDHDVTISFANHKTEQTTVNIKEGEISNIDITLSNIAQMTIDSKPTGAQLYIKGDPMGATPFTKEMSSGDYLIELQKNKYKTFKQTVHLDGSHPWHIITMQRQYLQPYSFYAQPFIKVGSNMSAGGAIGGYIANVNIEAFYAMGLKISEHIYWNSTTGEKPCGYSYKTTSMGGKFGYGLTFGTRIRLTPQAGITIVNLRKNKSYNETPSFDASKAYVASASIGAKFEYVIINHIGTFIAPEYDFAVNKSGYFTDMESISSTIKGFGSGFNLCAGISMFF